jgi:low affinity Fe/Cu permease
MKYPVCSAPFETDSRSRFDELAQRASYLASSPAFFGFCIALVLAWLGGYAVGAGASYEQATGSALAAATLLLVTGSPGRRSPA